MNDDVPHYLRQAADAVRRQDTSQVAFLLAKARVSLEQRGDPMGAECCRTAWRMYKEGDGQNVWHALLQTLRNYENRIRR